MIKYEPAKVSIDKKNLMEEYHITREYLGVDIDYRDFKYILWPDELAYRERLYHKRRHGD